MSCEGSIDAYEGRNATAQDPFHTLNTLEDIWLLSSMGSFLFLHLQNHESILFPRIGSQRHEFYWFFGE